MNGVLATLLLVVSPYFVLTYTSTMSSTLGISPTPRVSYVDDESVGPRGYGWQSGPNSFTIRTWTLRNAEPIFIKYVIVHELCHIALKHHESFELVKREVEADNCVKDYVGPAVWREMEASITRTNMLRLEHRRAGLVLSR